LLFTSLFLMLVAQQNVQDVSYELRLLAQDPGADLSTGRFDLDLVIWESFRQSPIFGEGANQIREKIWASDTLAKTEHGYVLHLGAYGAFALLFYLYILAGI